jgi:hypothetical protein
LEFHFNFFWDAYAFKKSMAKYAFKKSMAKWKVPLRGTSDLVTLVPRE